MYTYTELLKDIRLYLKKYPEDGKRLFKDIEEMVEEPEMLGLICPFCESSEYIYETSGKVICDCDPEI